MGGTRDADGARKQAHVTGTWGARGQRMGVRAMQMGRRNRRTSPVRGEHVGSAWGVRAVQVGAETGARHRYVGRIFEKLRTRQAEFSTFHQST